MSKKRKPYKKARDVGEDKRICNGPCERELPIENYYMQNPKTGRRETVCADCKKAEQRERYASDYVALRQEDFDVTVANDGRTDRNHGKAKRQEFSQAMGEMAGAVRRLATGGEAMPAELGAYMARLAEQERRFGNRRLARSAAISLAHEMLGVRMFKRAAAQFFSDKVAPAGYSARRKEPPPPGALDRTTNVLLSDLHLGAELSGVDNPQPFRRLEESRRLAYVFKQVLDYKVQYRDRTLCRVWLNGDLIEGLLGHDLRDGAPLTEQMVVFWHLFRQGLALLAAHFPRVEVECQPGNHGRDKIRHPGRATSSKWDGHEWRMMYALSMMFSHVPNIKFNLPMQAVSVVDVYGSPVAATHGDTEVPLMNPTTKHDDNVAEFQKVNASRELGCEVVLWLVGHFHSAFLAPGVPSVVYNGMLVPPNGFARSKGHRGKPCGQWIWESVRGYPLGDSRFVNVGPAQDHDETLDAILTPPKFG